MRDMENTDQVLALPEPLDDKAEYAVGQHINRIYCAVKSALYDLAVKDNQQNNVKDDLSPTRRPTHVAVADR